MFDTIGVREQSAESFKPKDASRNAWQSWSHEYTDPKTLERRVSVKQTLNRSEARIAISGLANVLSVESSLPKLVFGNNLQTLSDPKPALELLNEFLRDYVDGPFPKVENMPFSRVDYCHNFSVGDLLPDYIRTLSQIPFLKHRAAIDGYQGVEWWGKNGRRIRAYDKYQEILAHDRLKIPEARGNLRYEVEIRSKAGFLQRRVKKGKLTLSDVLDPTRAHVTLVETLNKMCFDYRFLPLDEARLVIDKNFSPRMATMLLGFLRRFESQKMEELRDVFPPSTLYRYRQKLREVGLYPPAVGKQELPGLQLPPMNEMLHPSEVSA
jgi:hypothetical protein